MTKIQRMVQCVIRLDFTQGWRHRVRALCLILVALIAMLSATVALGQASQAFDLACRSVMTGGGGTIASGSFAVTAALGLPIVPPQDADTAPTYAVRSSSFGVRAGFLPGYPTTVSAPPPALNPNQSYTQRLPILYNIVRIVRGGC